MLNKIRDLALETGFFRAEYLDMGSIQFYPEVRDACRQNTCRGIIAPGPVRLP